jgi:hypothetical protein
MPVALSHAPGSASGALQILHRPPCGRAATYSDSAQKYAALAMASPRPGAGRGCLLQSASRLLSAIGDRQGVRPPRPSSAILLPLLNSTSLLLQWHDRRLSNLQLRLCLCLPSGTRQTHYIRHMTGVRNLYYYYCVPFAAETCSPKR